MKQRDLERRIESLKALGETVRAMKNLSAHHFREVRAAVKPAAAYRQEVQRIAEEVGATLPAGPGAIGLVIIGAELGLCGSYNAKISAAARERKQQIGDGPTYCVGKRAASLLRRHGVEPGRTYASLGGATAITRLLLQLSQDVLGDYSSLRLSRLEVVSSRFEGIGSNEPTTTVLLPITAKSPTQHQSQYVSPDRLSAVAVRELLYCTLFDLLIEALACEHSSRLLATQAAEQWIDHATERSKRHLTAARREASTQEVIEISSGARARRAFAASN